MYDLYLGNHLIRYWLEIGLFTEQEMAVVNNSTVLIKNLDNEAYNLGTVTSNPRDAQAADIKACLDNLVIEPSEGTNDLVLAVIQYLFHDYFAFAHQSGLYNRQIRLWEMFSRITTIEVRQMERGFFTRKALPIYELVMKTARNQSPICAFIIAPGFAATDHYKIYGSMPKGKIYVDMLREFLSKVVKIQARLGANGVKGIFVVTPEPLEDALLAYIEKETRATDPVSKVESIMPSPVSAHINLLTYGFAHDHEQSPLAKAVITLAYPKLARKTAASNLG
jgi:hypothetical protein